MWSLFQKKNIIEMKNNNKNVSIVPVLSYDDAHAKKFIIFKENINKSGIYIWVNNINNKTYISSSISLTNKFYIYYDLNSLRRMKGSVIIYRALSKYGHSNFSLNIIEYCELSILNEREQYYIDVLKPKYNIKKK